jgi:hypothetical protein
MYPSFPSPLFSQIFPLLGLKLFHKAAFTVTLFVPSALNKVVGSTIKGWQHEVLMS